MALITRRSQVQILARYDRHIGQGKRLLIPFQRVCPAANEDILNFLFATAMLWKSMRNCLARKGGLLPETALARHRTIGGNARGPRIALRQRQFLGHFGAGPK